MKKRKITESILKRYRDHLNEDEKSPATQDKYLHDVRYFAAFADGERLSKALLLRYKIHLEQQYAVRSANSMIAALNSFLRFAGQGELCIKQFKLQKETYCPEEKELTKQEYERLVRTAEQKQNVRLSLVVQTICGTGIRVSELQCITVEAAQRGEAVVSCKGKTRKVFLVPTLKQKLLQYAREHGITQGAVFVTKQGSPLNRSNLWREMKILCEESGVNPEKVFPHNLRHLFARTFYGIEKDMAKLADILGHSNINTTRLYIVTSGAEHKRRMEQMHLVL